MAGPAVTIEPVCGVAAVFTAYAAGPASPAIAAAAIAIACSRRATARPNRNTIAAPVSTAPAASDTVRYTPPATLASATPQAAVATAASARPLRPSQVARWVQQTAPPIASAPPIAGARATV